MSHMLLKTNRFTVERCLKTLPDGRTVPREVIRHPGSVAILPLLDESTVVMIHNTRPAIGRELLELPAGTLEADEAPETCAARELEEETGYRAKDFELIGRFYTTPGYCDEYMHAYVATNLTHVGQNLDTTEEITVQMRAIDDLRRMIARGELEDSKTIAMLAAYLLRG